MPTRPEISELLERIVSGDETAVQEFGREYLPRFESQARHAGVRGGLSDDVAQEIYWATISQIQQGRLEHIEAFGSWLRTISQRKIADHFRANKHDNKLTSLDSSRDDQTDSPLNAKLAIGSVDLALVAGVHEALGRIPRELRAILLLKHYQGLTLKQIGKAVGKSMSTVYRNLCEAEELFRRLINAGDNLRAQSSEAGKLAERGTSE